MILTVTSNTCVDKTYTVENFRIDRVHRPSSWRIVAGGKGINVARVYNTLGGEALATGFAGGHNGDFILEELKKEGFQYEFVHTEGESRVCIAILDPVAKTQTELNEAGPEVSEDEVESLRRKFENLVRGKEFAVISGSTPPGVSDGFYRELIDIARHHGVRCVLDASGAALVEGLKANPYIAKPNVVELSYVVGSQLSTVEEAARAALDLSQRGIEIVIVTLGRDGAIVVHDNRIWWARSPEISFISAVGSGDSLAAAFVYILGQGGSPVDALRLGTAAGAANAMYFGAGFCTREDILQLNEKVEVTQFELDQGETLCP